MVVKAKDSSGKDIVWEGPSHYHDPLMTVSLFEKMNRECDFRDIVKLFSVLYNADYDLVFNAPEATGVEIYKAIRMIYESPLNITEIEMPKSIEINDKLMFIPTNIGRLSFGQLLALRKKIDKLGDEYTIDNSLVSFATALYLYPQYYGAVDESDGLYDKRLDELDRLVGQCQVLKVYPISFFLLSQQSTPGKIFVYKLKGLLENLKARVPKLALH